MGKVVVTEFVSLDGVFEDPGGSEGSRHGAWTFQFDRGSDGDRFKLDELMAAEVQLLGRVTYEGFAAAWPSIQDEVGFAERMNGMPKYVVSTTLRDPEWNNSTVIPGNVPEEVAKLRERTSGDILIAGSGQLVRALTRHDLVDEYRLMVFPVILGSGKRLFADGDEDLTRLTLAESKQVGPDGVLALTYRRASS
ncbi:MAG: dihydrofolate reductase family protein [Candidatus Dormibacteraeota bacterium]|nr:dihydrofolate reductase family protein [Candidatus Dormibacteraeota bacterium]MBO0759753.1 dihydrofolate reductase family protein [Candidatus Dormibacteraeota bacterium]